MLQPFFFFIQSIKRFVKIRPLRKIKNVFRPKNHSPASADGFIFDRRLSNKFPINRADKGNACLKLYCLNYMKPATKTPLQQKEIIRCFN